ncbi:MAG TPA: 5'-nucleotidase [Fimbriimonadaceae bacterium]|nr:5'-nucleotidase [Fimbriimonadaceae bacterium]
MPQTLDDKLVIAVTSMALFDFSEPDRVFREQGEDAFREHQKQRIDEPASPGVAFNLVSKLLRLNSRERQVVEVIVMSKNDPFSGLRVFNSAKFHGLNISRGLFTRGRSPFHYLRAAPPTLFLSANDDDVRRALAEGIPAARVGDQAPTVSNAHPTELRIAIDGDGVLFDDRSEAVYARSGLETFHAHEEAHAEVPMQAGPLWPFVKALRKVQDEAGLELRLALVTARGAPAHERALKTLDDWGLEVDEAFFLGGLSKAPFLLEFGPDIFFDDQETHIQLAEGVAAVAHVPFGVRNVPPAGRLELTEIGRLGTC